MDVGDRISYYLDRKEMQQKDLAKKINMDPAVLNRIIKNSRPARGTELADIADVLGVSIEDLLGRKIPASTVEVQPSNTAISDEELHELFLRAQSELPADKRKLFIKMAKAALEDEDSTEKTEQRLAYTFSDSEAMQYPADPSELAKKIIEDAVRINNKANVVPGDDYSNVKSLITSNDKSLITSNDYDWSHAGTFGYNYQKFKIHNYNQGLYRIGDMTFPATENKKDRPKAAKK